MTCHTKLGITYLDRNGVTRFDPILIVNQKDSYEAFNYFNTNSTLQFNGESSGFGSIYAALQHFIDTHKNKIYFNGDWNSMSALLGLNTAAAYYPCIICTIHKDNIDSLTAHSKREECVIGEYSQVSSPLLIIPSDRIVPLPLHVFLGIGNKIIKDILIQQLYVDEKKLHHSISLIKSTSQSGLSSIFALTGQELYDWSRISTLLAQLTSDNHTQTERDNIAKVLRWVRELGASLFHRREWTRADRVSFSSLVAEMRSKWKETTNTPVTPKVHMLSHAVEFIQLHHSLGTHSEAHIESYHARFNKKYSINHRKKSDEEGERIRRCHADLLLISVEQFIDE